MTEAGCAIPHQSYSALFLRFLRFGLLAWGGPVAQIGMIKQELVDEERWITPDRFGRALAVYQVLPGPEAHELCVYFGMLARGRPGGLLAGLGFMLPGFILMFLLSWAYVASAGSVADGWSGVFAALQAAVIALIVRAIHRIGSHAVTDRWLLALAVLACVAGLLGVHFSLALGLAGLGYLFLGQRQHGRCLVVALAGCAAVAYVLITRDSAADVGTAVAVAQGSVSVASLFYSGLKSGLLTFGGAYTAIPLLQHDAVEVGGWMTNDQFLDGLALSGILPAPLIIFATFVGFLGGRMLGSVALTTGVFLPAFSFTLVAHDALERVTHDKRLRRFLDGVTAAVVGLITASALQLAPVAQRSPATIAVFVGALVLLYRIRHKLSVLLVVALAALAGLLLP